MIKLPATMSLAEARLRMLRRRISEATEVLNTLRRAIAQARSDESLTALEDVHLENNRLREATHAAAAHLDSVNAELSCAVRASQTDALTGTFNRNMLWSQLEHELAVAKRWGLPLAVLFLDIDDFKQINDTHGHLIGDILLKQTAARLREALRESDTICRYGGDEFVVLLANVPQQDLPVLVDKIRSALDQPTPCPCGTLSVAVSIGVALYPNDALEPSALVRKADEAMYQAKAHAKGPPAARWSTSSPG